MPIQNGISGKRTGHNHRIQIKYVDIKSIMPAGGNPRRHRKQQIGQIAASIRQFGLVLPILIDSSRNIVAGEAVWRAACHLGLPEVPVTHIAHLKDAEVRALRIALNKLPELSSWDMGLLTSELEFLSEVSLNHDFDIDVTGFTTAEIDQILTSPGNEPDDADSDDDELPEPALHDTAVSQPGDLWILGPHRLYCGNALEQESFQALMGSEAARMVFTDPPYNVPINGHVSGLGKTRHREFAMAAGEMSPAQFTAFLERVLQLLCAHSLDGSIHYICMDWRHMRELMNAALPVYAKQMNLCVWNKDNGGMGSFYRSKHELVFVYKHGRAKHINNFGLGENGRWRTNVWDYAGVNSIKKDRMEELAMHPTVKPVGLIADAMRDCSHPGDITLDCFAGSGSSFIAAERTGRRAYGMELDPVYVDVIIRRWQAVTRQSAYHHETGLSFQKRQTTLTDHQKREEG